MLMQILYWFYLCPDKVSQYVFTSCWSFGVDYFVLSLYEYTIILYLLCYYLFFGAWCTKFHII